MWTGQHNVQVGQAVIGIGYDDPILRAALREAFEEAPGDASEGPVPDAFGVRSVRVGLRRRRLWLVYHGSSVRHRAGTLPDAVSFLHDLLRAIDRRPEENEFEIPFRVYVKGDRAVLVDVPPGADVDERPLAKLDIVQLPTWSAFVDRHDQSVRNCDDVYSLVAIAVGRTPGTPMRAADDLRSLIWSRTSGADLDWAWTLNDLGASIIDSDNLSTTLRRRLS